VAEEPGVKISGSYTLDAPRDEVWAALNDIDVLARVVPGCERLEQTGEHEYEGTVKIGIQSIKGAYSGKIRLEDVQPPHHYKLVASGRSANGVVDGSGTVDLLEQDGKTILTYSGDVAIGGTLASVGQRLIEGASRQLLNQSLKALAEQVSRRRESAAPPTDGSAPPQATALAVPAAEAPTAESPAAPAAAPVPPERRTVVVPEDEQLKPEAVLTGAALDFVKENPWLIGVIAFILGFLLGRSSRRVVVVRGG
jgi:carbon monoxide dehydrogenase subunit G